MGLFDSVFGTGDPSKGAMPYLDKIPGVGKQYYNPFIDRGARAGNTLEDQYGKMMDPTSFMDEIMKHYNMSEGAQYEQDKLGKGMAGTAAAGGVAGTPQHQQEFGEMAHKIMSGDMQQYLKNALGIQDRGLKGEENFFDKGFDASGSLADLIGGTYGSQAGLKFQGQQQQNMNRQGLMKALGKLLSTGAGAYYGGIPGAEAGSKVFG